MSITVTLAEAQASLKDLISALGPDDHLIITENNRPVAEVRKIVDGGTPKFGRGAGLCTGMVVDYIDDDEHLADFREYME